MKKEIDTKGKERGSTDDDVGVRFSLLIPLRKEKKKNNKQTTSNNKNNRQKERCLTCCIQK